MTDEQISDILDAQDAESYRELSHALACFIGIAALGAKLFILLV